MIIIGLKNQVNSVLIEYSTFQILEKIPWTEKTHSESWLQDIIHQNPEILQ